jgi:hypothetical protein
VIAALKDAEEVLQIMGTKCTPKCFGIVTIGIVSMIWTGGSAAQGKPSNTIATDTKLAATGVMVKPALSQLLEIGRQNHIPMGIVLADDGLCRASLSKLEPQASVGQLMAKIEVELNGYTSELKDGVLHIGPTPTFSITAGFLNTSIPHFVTGPDTHQMMGVHLWMFIRAVLAPNEGSGFVGGESTNAEIVEGFETTDSTISQILDRIVATGGAAAWVLDARRSDLTSLSSVPPYQIRSYADLGVGWGTSVCHKTAASGPARNTP